MHIRSLAVEAKMCFDLEKIKNLVDENFCNVANILMQKIPLV